MSLIKKNLFFLKERGFCELLSENQLDNPRLMRPFKQAVYYENIKCRLDDDTQQNELKIRPGAFRCF